MSNAVSHYLRCAVDEEARSEVEPFLDRHAIEWVKVVWCDLHGIARGKTLSRRRFWEEVRQGITFSVAPLYMDLRGEVVDPAGTASRSGWTSCYACPELDSLRLSSIEERTAEVVVHLHQDRPGLANPPSAPIPLPREELRQILRRVEEDGYELLIGSELEFYLLDGEGAALLPPGKNCYRLIQGSREKEFLQALQEALRHSHLTFEAMMAEDGPGQFEVVLAPSSALLHADEVFLTRNVVKSLAAARGMTATFLSKPVEGESGCGYHIHQTLTSRGETHSLFDASRFGETGSQRLGHFIAGQLQHLRDLSTLLLPTVNSYKRILTRGVQPLSLTWGEDNRTVALRVVSRNTAEARVENRVPAGECNPYLAIAASVAAGVQGILEAASAPPPTTGNAFQEGCDAPRLPGNLGEAVGLLRGSAMARQWFSEDLLSRFIALKQDEWERYLRSVTDWERQEYLAFL